MYRTASGATCCSLFTSLHSKVKEILHAERPATPEAKTSSVSKPQIDEASHTGAAWENNREEADWDEEEKESGKPDPLGEDHPYCIHCGKPSGSALQQATVMRPLRCLHSETTKSTAILRRIKLCSAYILCKYLLDALSR